MSDRSIKPTAPIVTPSGRLTNRVLHAAIVFTVFAASAAVGWPAHAAATRIKEVAAVQGVRSNQLIGYGLVVGLDGTGDQSQGAPFTAQSLAAMLSQMGVAVPPGVQLQA